MNTVAMVAPSLSTEDVRAMFRLVGEVRELGHDPVAWRSHLARGLHALCGCRATVANEITARRAPPEDPEDRRTCSVAVELVDHATHGVDDHPRFYDDVLWFDHETDSTLNGFLPLYGTSFTRLRARLVDDATWLASDIANDRFRASDCGDFIASMSVTPLTRMTISSLYLYRGWGERPFGEREQAIVAIVHEELARDFMPGSGPSPSVKLTPRARAVLERLTQGDSEKEIAAHLDISTHTVHDHVKAIHRAYGVRSRGELLARVAQTSRRGVRLVSPGP